MHPVDVGGVAVLLVRVDHAWLAVADRCSHADCAFSEDGSLDGTTVICECHGSEFDLGSGAVLVPPAREPIATHETRVVDGKVEVAL